MLPPLGSKARTDVEDEALQIGLQQLKQENGDLLQALYLTYMELRMRFIQERGLMDTVPGAGPEWTEALTDARVLQEHVNQLWAAVIATTLSDNCACARSRR